VWESWIRVLTMGGGPSLANSSIMMWSWLICCHPMKPLNRSGLICPIMIDDHLVLICSLTFWWILGDALAGLGVELNHRGWYLLSCKNFWKLDWSNTKSGAHTYRAPCFSFAVMRVLKVIEVVWSIDRGSLAFQTKWCTSKKYKIRLGTSIESPSWFVRGVALVKSIRYG
jgi:hypothetical protein